MPGLQAAGATSLRDIAVDTENFIRVDDAPESPKLAE